MSNAIEAELAAIRIVLANGGVTPHEGETTLAMVERMAIELDKARAKVARLDAWLTDEHARARTVSAGVARERDEQRTRAEGAEAELVALRAQVEALVSAERRATERAEGRPLSEPWNADAVSAVQVLLHDDSR